MSRDVEVPAFLIIGAQRCGTTSLYNYLLGHPDIAPAARKELRFFDHRFDRGLDWYRAQFSLATSSGTVSGEATPYYLFHPHAPARTRACAPWARLIVLLRNPVDRAYSHYWHEVRRGHETLSFEEAIASEVERLAGERERMVDDDRYQSFNHQHYSYLARGHYADQLAAWTAHFPREQILVLRSEDLYREPAAAFDRTVAFLGLPPTSLIDQSAYNEGRNPPMRGGTRRRLDAYFEAPNQQLQEFLGRDFSWNVQ